MLTYRGSPHEEVLWASDRVRIGIFDARPDEPDFATAGQVVSAPSLVFAWRPVRIRWGRSRAHLADVDGVLLHNVGDEYRREALSREGDRSIWFHVAPAILSEALEAHGISAPGDPRRPFSTFGWVPVDDRSCVLYAALTRHLKSAGTPDPVFVEEAALRIFDRVLANASDRRLDPRGSTGDHRDLVQAARETLSARWEEPVHLEEVAGAVGVSVFHLCRVFRRTTGTTLHRHLLQIRLRRSLERVPEPAADLSAIAFDHGFSSHSHFTSWFRTTFGMTPSTFRRRVGGSAQGLLRSTAER